MKGFHRILLSIYVGMITYLILSFFFGSSGIVSMEGLERYERELEPTIADLESRNGELRGQIESLLTDPDRIRLEARSLGFYRDTEGVIRIPSGGNETRSYNLGRILEERPEVTDRRALFRIIAFIVVLSAYALLSVFKGPSGTILRHSK